MSRYTITHIEAGEILDSRGNPTVQTSVALAGGAQAAVSVPSGASTGSHEAHELRDGNLDRYNGKGVLKACSYVNTIIADAIRGFDCREQVAIDRALISLDGTPQKTRLGANALLSVSLACAHAAAAAVRTPLYAYIRNTWGFKARTHMPIPFMNVINGGKHGDTNITVQEFHIVPHLDEKATMAKRIEAGSEVYRALRIVLQKHNLDTDLGDEAGYAPDVETLDSVFEYIVEAIKQAGYTAGTDISLGLDIAATELWDSNNQTYTIAPPEQKISSTDLARLYQQWIRTYPIISIEDPFQEEAWDAWADFTKSVSEKKVLVVGDDLLVTHKARLKMGIEQGAMSAILVKPNQVGTLTETIETIQLAQRNNIQVVVSHRSGETNDTTIADIAVGVGAEYLKAGAPSQGERVAKYNRLLAIENNLP